MTDAITSVLITGSVAGIGVAVAVSLNAQGYELILVDKDANEMTSPTGSGSKLSHVGARQRSRLLYC